jgi:hypothetical protein
MSKQILPLLIAGTLVGAAYGLPVRAQDADTAPTLPDSDETSEEEGVSLPELYTPPNVEGPVDEAGLEDNIFTIENVDQIFVPDVANDELILVPPERTSDDEAAEESN